MSRLAGTGGKARRAPIFVLAGLVFLGAVGGALSLAESDEARLARGYDAAYRRAVNQGLPETFRQLQAIGDGPAPDASPAFASLAPDVQDFYGGRNPMMFQGDLTPARVARFISASRQLERLNQAQRWSISKADLANVEPLLMQGKQLDMERLQFLGVINMQRSIADLQLALGNHEEALAILHKGLDAAQAYRLRPFASSHAASLMAAQAIARDAGRIRLGDEKDKDLFKAFEAMLDRIQDQFLKPSDTRGSLWMALARIQARGVPGSWETSASLIPVTPELSRADGPRDPMGKAMAVRVLQMAEDFRQAEKEILTDKAPQHGDIIAFVRKNSSAEKSAAWLPPLRRESAQQLRQLAELRQVLMDLRMSMGLPPRR